MRVNVAFTPAGLKPPEVQGRGNDAAANLGLAAGRLAAAILGSTKPRRELNDAGLASLDLVRRYGDHWERPLAYSRSGRRLMKLGFRADVRDAARLDAYPVLAQYHERRVTLAGTRERGNEGTSQQGNGDPSIVPSYPRSVLHT